MPSITMLNGAVYVCPMIWCQQPTIQGHSLSQETGSHQHGRSTVKVLYSGESDKKITMNEEKIKIWKEAVVAYLRHIPGMYV
jgi:hypothetical protein